VSNDSRNNYSNGIDIVRFIGFFCVFIHHFVYQGGNSIYSQSGAYWQNQFVDAISYFGAEGVTIFFCLSGFLLSKLLLKEHLDTGRISVKSFYKRRILRIWPLYFGYILFCLALTPVFGSQSIQLSELPSLLTFTYNWQQLFSGQSRGMAAVLWSISVEEQIYFFLPLLLVLFIKRNINLLGCLLVFFGIASRFILYYSDQSLYRNTFSYMSTIGIGVLFAIHEHKLRNLLNPSNLRFRFIFLGLVAAYVLSFKSIFSSGPLTILAFDLTALVTVILVLLLDEKGKHSLSGLRKFLGFLGRRTYGMYIFHWPVLALLVSREFFFSDSLGVSFLGLLFALILVISISILSYRYLEKPFLEKRLKYQYVKVG
jgi:peptidoglycan/LPS O-acetylase OafA/YrhL